MCIERWHVSRSAFCNVAVRTRPGCNRFTVLICVYAADKCIHVRATAPWNSLSYFLSSRFTHHCVFFSLAILRTSCHTDVSRATVFFVRLTERVSAGASSRFSDEKKIADYSPRLLHGSSTDRQDECWKNLISNIYTRNEDCEGIYPRAKTYLKHRKKFFAKKKYNENKHLFPYSSNFI